jgi:cytochrome c oxidase subunit 2
MLLRVIAHPPGEFEQWVAAQRHPPVEDPQARVGREVFFSTSCVNCHAVNGTQARGTFGPDLTHLMSRETLASGAAPNTPETLRVWVRDPQTLKEGCLMPNMQLADTELDHLVAYLLSLK